MRFEIGFSGHQNIRSNHRRTIEITKDTHLTTQGDCIVGVNATAGCADLPAELKQKLKDPSTNVSFLIRVENYEFSVSGKGHEKLTFSDPNDIVIRKSDFVCPRTLAIKCDKASDLLPREMVLLLQNPQTRGVFVVTAE